MSGLFGGNNNLHFERFGEHDDGSGMTIGLNGSATGDDGSGGLEHSAGAQKLWF